MTTGPFWDVSKPLKPLGYFDNDSVLDIPFDWSEWLDDIGATLLSAEAETELPLEVVGLPDVDTLEGIVTVRIQLKAGEERPAVGTKFRVRCHIVATDGQEEDQTVWLKVREK